MGEMLSKAIIIATKAHQGQVDKGGDDYILHPIRVMTKPDTEEERIVGVLHDIIEDTEVTFEDLKVEEFSTEVISALKHLTRGKNEKYFDYIEKIKQNFIAKKVKLVDLEDNMDISRIPNPTNKDCDRLEKYKKAKNRLTKK